MDDKFEARYAEPWVRSSPYPDPSTMTTVMSAPVPSGTHVLMTAGTPGDDSLYQFIDLSYADWKPDTEKPDLGDVTAQMCRTLHSSGFFGLGKFHGRFPEKLGSVRMVRGPHWTDLYCTDEEGADKFILSVYRRVWPGIPHEVQVLSTLTGSYSPDLIGHLEVEHGGQPYVLGAVRRLPTGINAFDYSRMGAEAHVFSHAQGIDLGQTLRYIHDSLLLAFGYEWQPATTVAAQLEERLDDLVARAPVLAEYAPWIRDWYRSLRGEVFVQRLHGNMSLRRMWFEDDGSWFIGGWEGDLRLPLEERVVTGCPLSDFATLQRSLFWACLGNKPWCMKTMGAIFEGYGEPMQTRLFSAYVLDRAAQEVVEHTSSPVGQPEVALEFFTWFVDNALPNRDQMQPSQFHRED